MVPSSMSDTCCAGAGARRDLECQKISRCARKVKEIVGSRMVESSWRPSFHPHPRPNQRCLSSSTSASCCAGAGARRDLECQKISRCARYDELCPIINLETPIHQDQTAFWSLKYLCVHLDKLNINKYCGFTSSIEFFSTTNNICIIILIFPIKVISNINSQSIKQRFFGIVAE